METLRVGMQQSQSKSMRKAMVESGDTTMSNSVNDAPRSAHIHIGVPLCTYLVNIT